MPQKFVAWFKDVNKEDIALVGGKGANLGEMTQAGFPVPNGFIVTSESYYHFLAVNKLPIQIKKHLDKLDVNNTTQLKNASQKIRTLIESSPIPHEIAKEIFHAYFHSERGLLHNPLVAVRSSATAEDLPTASFAGQQETFLNIKGEANLLEKIRACWSSLFTARAIFYRETNKFDHFKVGIAVPVQKMVESQMSGVMFTLDPVTNNKSRIIIEAIYGLGEMIVQGAVTPDHYEVDKESQIIMDKVTRVQEKKMVRKNGKNVILPLQKREGGKTKLSDGQIQILAKLGKQLENHYYFPQDAEWAIEKGRVYLVQTRPVTTTGNKDESTISVVNEKDIILRGDPASPGIASGSVKILQSAKEIHKISHGDILVAEQTNPDYVPAMKKAAAIVTERGGRTSHAAIVSRELGIPAIVGTDKAMTTLKDGMVITVNGSTGVISKGSFSAKTLPLVKPRTDAHHPKTATKVYVNLAEPERAAAIARYDVDGVGLLRAEFMIAGIGVHPKKLITEHKEQVFIEKLSSQIALFCKAFAPRPVIYRTTDFKTNEYRNLTGGKQYEPEEPNPMLGYRGATRYIADPAVFVLELEALKYVRNKLGHKNLWCMIPFVRSPEELTNVKQLMAAHDLSRSSTFKLFLMCEIPTNVIRLDDFLDVGVDGVSIGSNDLTMLILGTDRDNSEVAKEFNERDPAVLWALEKVVRTCSKRDVSCSICGQAPSDYPDLVEKLVSWGITSVSVNPDAIERVRESIVHAEHDLIHKK